MKLKDMTREEILDLRDRAYAWLAYHKFLWWKLRVQFGIARKCSRLIMDGHEAYWPKLDEDMKGMTSLAPHYFDDMRQALIDFEPLVDTCAEIQDQIDRLEPVYKDAVDKWLDIKRSLEKPPEPGPAKDGTEVEEV